MRTWLKAFLLMLTVLLGGSALWVWAAALTGNVGKAVVLTETNGFDIGGIIRANTWALHQLGGDPSPPPSGDLLIYAKTGSSDVFTRDPAGNIKNFFSAGTGGTGVGLTARLITTTNMDLTGEETIEGILTSATRVFVAGQSTGTQNGLYVTGGGAWTRATDAATGASFTAGTLVTLTDGIAGATGNKGTTWMYTTSGTYNTSTLTAVKTAYGPSTAAFELAANKNVASGYAGLTSATKQIWTQRGDAATHAPINLTGQITPTASTMRVSGSGTPPVTMTSGNPRILGCTTTADDGKELTIEGSDATNTLTMPTGNGVQLCGNTGNIVFGLNLGRARFICDGIPTPKVWRQADCPTLQTVANVGRTIVADETTPVIIANAAGSGRFERYVDSSTGIPTDRAICAGVTCLDTTMGPLPVGGSVRVLNNAAAEIFKVSENGTITPGVRGTVTTSFPLRLDTPNFANGNALISPRGRTNYDTNVLEFAETGTGCAYFRADIPVNVSGTGSWGISLSHSLASGGAANVFLTAAAKTFGHGDAKDAALTPLPLAGSPAGKIAVQTSTNLTRTALAPTTFDGTVALAASRLLRVSLCRVPADGSDDATVSWFMESAPVLTLLVN